MKANHLKIYPDSNAVAERVNGIIKNEFNLEKYKVDLNTFQKIIAQTIKISIMKGLTDHAHF